MSRIEYIASQCQIKIFQQFQCCWIQLVRFSREVDFAPFPHPETFENIWRCFLGCLNWGGVASSTFWGLNIPQYPVETPTIKTRPKMLIVVRLRNPPPVLWWILPLLKINTTQNISPFSRGISTAIDAHTHKKVLRAKFFQVVCEKNSCENISLSAN